MRRGGGHAKGSAFERYLCVALSKWLTSNERDDLFSRNVLSGGRFTNRTKAGKDAVLPGDIAAAHPRAFEFLKLFCVEAKFHRNIGLDTLLFEPRKSFLSRTYDHTARQARAARIRPMVIAKQNFRDTIVLVDREVGECATKVTEWTIQFHCLRNNSLMLLRFDDLIHLVPPTQFLLAVEELHNITPFRPRSRLT